MRTDLAEIYEQMSMLSDRDDVEEFAIGTTSDLARTRALLRAEEIVSIYDAHSYEEAAEVEDALRARFTAHAKCAREGGHEPDAGTWRSGATPHVFAALWRTI